MGFLHSKRAYPRLKPLTSMCVCVCVCVCATWQKCQLLDIHLHSFLKISHYSPHSHTISLNPPPPPPHLPAPLPNPQPVTSRVDTTSRSLKIAEESCPCSMTCTWYQRPLWTCIAPFYSPEINDGTSQFTYCRETRLARDSHGTSEHERWSIIGALSPSSLHSNISYVRTYKKLL